MFLSRQWWNPQPFLKNCIRIVTGFHQFYCLFFSLTCRTIFHNVFYYLALIAFIVNAFWICISKQCLRFSKPTLADLSAHGSSARQIPMKYAQQGNSSTLSFDIWLILNDFRLSYWHLLSLSFVLDEYFPLQVCVDGEAWVRRSLPAHNLLQLLGSQTSILCSDLFPNRPRLSASLWKVCAWSPDRRQTSNCLPPEPTGQFYCCLALYHSVFDIKLKYNCLFIWSLQYCFF